VAFVVMGPIMHDIETADKFEQVEGELRQAIDHDAPLIDIDDDQDHDAMERIDSEH